MDLKLFSLQVTSESRPRQHYITLQPPEFRQDMRNLEEVQK